MPKKCVICGEAAKFNIKDTSDFYCEECAKEQFADLSLLVSVEEEAKKLKKIIEDKMDDSYEESSEEQENNS